jgi:CBS domain-containing protein
MATTVSSWAELLKVKTVRDAMIGKNSAQPWGEFELVFANTTDSVADTTAKFVRHHIQAMPLRNESSGDFEGFVTVDDIVLMKMFLAHSKEWLELLTKKDIDFAEFTSKVDSELAATNVSDAKNASERNPWVTISSSAPLTECIDMMSKDAKLHRMAVTDEGGKVVGLVTQFGVARCLAKSIESFPDVGARKIGDVLQARELITATLNERVVDAFTRLMESAVTGIPVVSDGGELVDVISSTDVLKASEGHFADLYKPVGTFLKRDDEFKVATATVDTTARDALQVIVEKHIHRLFVVDGHTKKPNNVVSLTDLFLLLK